MATATDRAAPLGSLTKNETKKRGALIASVEVRSHEPPERTQRAKPLRYEEIYNRLQGLDNICYLCTCTTLNLTLPKLTNNDGGDITATMPSCPRRRCPSRCTDPVPGTSRSTSPHRSTTAVYQDGRNYIGFRAAAQVEELQTRPHRQLPARIYSRTLDKSLMAMSS